MAAKRPKKNMDTWNLRISKVKKTGDTLISKSQKVTDNYQSIWVPLLKVVCGFGRWESLDPLESELQNWILSPEIDSGIQNVFRVNDFHDLIALRVPSGVNFQVLCPEWKSQSCAWCR